MENKELFEQRKSELLKRAEEKGYLTILSLRMLCRRFKLNDEEFKEIWKEIEDANFEIIPVYQAKVREMTDVNEKINFCYYVLICKTLNEDVDLSKYSKNEISGLIPLIDKYITTNLNNLEQDVINAYYGLKNGELLEDDQKAIKAIGCIIDQYIDVKTSAFRKLKSRGISKIIETYRKTNCIDEYKVTTVTSGSKDCFLFAPYSHGEQICGPAILQSKEENGSTDIGYISAPGQLGYSFTIYKHNGEDSCLIFYNKDKAPRPEIYFCKDYISIGLYYPGLGYHGNLFTFKQGKNVTTTHYWEGASESEKELNCKMDDLPTVSVPFKQLKSGVVECHILESYKEFVTEENEGVSSCVRIEKNGKTMIGQYERGNFNGLVIESGEHNKIIISKYAEGFQDDSFVVIANTITQTIEFKYKNKEGNFCSIYYDASDAFHSLIVSHKKENGEQIDSVILSNPQGDSSALVKKASDNSDGKTCEEKLNDLIGLDNVKKMIKRLKALLVKNKNENIKPNLNMFFTGNPGTGKTEVARLLAGILYDNGIIKENKFIEVDRSGLVGRYVGESEKNTDQIIKNAMGGVLFIDEAYSLYTGWDDKDYGNQVIDKLVKAMEDNKGNICIIFAGYKDAMEKLYSMNQGLASRINRKIDFPNYSVDELKLITNKFLNDCKYQIDDDAMNEISEIMESRLSDKNFANARDVRNILEAVYEIQAERTSDDSNDRKIILADLQTYEEEAHVIKNKKDNTAKYYVDYNEIKNICLSKTDFTFSEQYVQEASVNIKILDKAFGNVISEGSGFFISSDGLIGTCAHVIKDAPFIRVVVNIFTSKGKKITKTYNATVVGFDEKTDVGLIKIDNPGEYEFSYYPIEEADKLPASLDEIVMGGYPLGGERFEKISINEGRIQSYNKDQALGDESSFDKIYVDLTGSAGNSGSGVINKLNGRCIGIYAGASLGYSSNVQFKLNYSIPTKYLWELLKKCSN